MLTRAITKGTTNGKTIAPARGVMATNQRKDAGALESEGFRTTRRRLR
jgi:hypothetical protein